MLFDLFGTLVDDEGRAIDGAIEMLARLAQSRTAIVTSCSRRLALGLLTHAQLPNPQVLVAGDDVAANKPAPDGYLAAARSLQVAPERCLVVEDSRQGIAAGRAAGMDVAAILRGRTSVFAAAATHLVADLRALDEMLVLEGTLRIRS